jgi:hypothetical protein
MEVTDKLDRSASIEGWRQSRLQNAMAISSNPLSSTRKSREST